MDGEILQPSVYNYMDYREFLRDVYLFRKNKSANFSYGYISQKVQLDRSIVIKIIKGERHLTHERAGDFAFLFGLDKKEADYFSLLLEYNKAKTAKLRSELRLELEKKKPLLRVDLDQSYSKLFEHWYTLALWSIVGMRKCTMSTQFSSFLLLPVSNEMCLESIQILLDYKLIQVDEQGYLSKTTEHLCFKQEQKVIDKYHQDLFLMLYDPNMQARTQLQSSSLVVEIPEHKLPEIQQWCVDLKERISAFARDEECNQVFQFAFHTVPLTKKI